MYCYNCMKQINDGSEFCFNCGKPVNSNHPPHHLKPGTILHNQYLVGNSIGEGGFGITYVGLDLSLDMKIAIKEFYPSGYANRNNTHSNNVTLNYQSEGEYFKSGVENFLREARSIAKFNNESSIVDVRAFFEENGTAYIIMEYLDGENLSDKIKRDGKFKSQEIFNLFLPMMGTLEKLHNENIIHRDISPENIRCMPDNTLKLMDFGSARYYAGIDKKTMSVQYKPGYAPFEQYNKNGNQGPWTDVYGLCATIYKCITGVTPVDSLERCQNDTLKKPSELGADITPSLEQVLMYGLGVYPENRCKSMSELADITRKALNNSNAVINSGAVAAGVVYGTQIADDQNKTMYADKTYGDSFTNQNKNGVNNVNYYKGGENNINRNQNNNQQNSSQIQKKKKKNYVPLIITLVVVAVIGFGVLGFFLFNNLIGNKTDDNSATSSQTEQAEQTEAPTLAAAVETEPDKDADLVTVPDVKGKKLSDAANEFSLLNLKIDTSYENNAEYAEGYIVRQSVEAGRKINKGDTIMLVVSSGNDTNSPFSENNKSNSSNFNSPPKAIDVDSEVAVIRENYYSTQANPGIEKTINGVKYYYKDNSITKIVCYGNSDTNYSREYFYKDNKLYFAFIFNGNKENRLYYCDNTLIRYIDENKNTFDYDGTKIDCPFSEFAENESVNLLQQFSR